MKNTLIKQKPFLGFGLGLRTEYYQTILAQKPAVDWFEILTENYLIAGGKPLYFLDKIRADYPVVMHGVSMSIGSTDPLDWNYLKQVQQLAARIEPRWISDHLCWTGIQGKNTHDLLPIPYTEEAIQHIVERIEQIQAFLNRQILLENVSSYVAYTQSSLSEWEFLREISERADCHILLDINNVYVSSVNHAFNPLEYIQAIPAKRVHQIHLAGHLNKGDYIIDTHDQDIIPAVWDLYAATLKHTGCVSTMIERDDNFPEFNVLLAELNKARLLSELSLSESAA